MTISSDAYARIVERSVSDSEFRRDLVADPAGTLRAAGVNVGYGATIKVVEDSETVTHLVLPPALDENILSDRELDAVAGGARRHGTNTEDCTEVCVRA